MEDPRQAHQHHQDDHIEAKAEKAGAGVAEEEDEKLDDVIDDIKPLTAPGEVLPLDDDAHHRQHQVDDHEEAGGVGV